MNPSRPISTMSTQCRFGIWFFSESKSLYEVVATIPNYPSAKGTVELIDHRSLASYSSNSLQCSVQAPPSSLRRPVLLGVLVPCVCLKIMFTDTKGNFERIGDGEE